MNVFSSRELLPNFPINQEVLDTLVFNAATRLVNAELNGPVPVHRMKPELVNSLVFSGDSTSTTDASVHYFRGRVRVLLGQVTGTKRNPTTQEIADGLKNMSD
jgi:hypothetical protein